MDHITRGAWMRRARQLAAVALLGAAAPAFAQLVLYEHDNFQGRSHTTSDRTPNLAPLGFNDLASSVEVRGGQWQLCEDADYGGHCIVLNPGRYASLRALGMNDRVSSVRQMAAGAGTAAIELFEHDDFEGRVFAANAATSNLQPLGFNDLASSVVVHSGRWELCSDAEYRGRCVTLEPGRYRRLRERELNDMVSSLRPLDAPGAAAPVVELGKFNTWRVGYADGCSVFYDAERRRGASEPGCTPAQLMQADEAMARQPAR